MQACFYKKYMGIECPGCGMQRSFIEFLKGNFHESFVLFPALFPVVAMLVYLILHVIFKFRKGAEILKILFISNTIIIVLNYVYKIIIQN